MKLQHRFPPGPRSPGAARRALDALAGELPSDALEKVRLLVSELVTNSVRHADLRPDDLIELTVTLREAGVRVEVRDPGTAGGVELVADRPSASGWGLFLVDQMADRWGTQRSTGTVVWFEIDLRRATRAPQA